jgi:hypothetical protein
MANWGQILAGGVSAAADSASGILGKQIQEDADKRAADRQLANQERLMATQEMMKQRAKEWDQNAAKSRAMEINAKADGILGAGTSEPVVGYEGDSGDVGVAKGAIPGNAEASDIDRVRARTRAAEELGYMTEAKEARGILDVERKLSADEARAAAQEAQQTLQRDLAAAKDKKDRDLAEQKHQQTLVAIQGKSEKGVQVVDRDGNIKVLSAGEINKGEYKPVSSLEGDRKTTQAEEARVQKNIAQKESQIPKLFGKEREQAMRELAEMKRAAGIAAPAPNPNRRPLSAFGG